MNHALRKRILLAWTLSSALSVPQFEALAADGALQVASPNQPTYEMLKFDGLDITYREAGDPANPKIMPGDLDAANALLHNQHNAPDRQLAYISLVENCSNGFDC